jgi:hypothetical protein
MVPSGAMKHLTPIPNNRAEQTAILNQLLERGRLPMILKDLMDLCHERWATVKPTSAEWRLKTYWSEQTALLDAAYKTAEENEHRLHS